jgi:outer membrane lipoprotein-sorting protein
MSKHTTVGLIHTNGVVVESLSSNASLSYLTSDQNISGSGYLMYRKPDHIRAVILSPFGSVLQEVIVSGDLVTIIDSSNGIAFSGMRVDLPDKGAFSGWRYFNWLIDIDKPDSSFGNTVVERINRFGQREEAVFENGRLLSKSTVAGGHVRYVRYATQHEITFPLEIIYETATKDKFTILLEDPEINVVLADSVFTPDLSKLRVYPLSNLK